MAKDIREKTQPTTAFSSKYDLKRRRKWRF